DCEPPTPYSRVCFRVSAFVYEVGGRIVFVHPCTQMVELMFACVTSGLSTPGVRVMSAWYGPFDEEPCGETIAIARIRRAIATRAVRVDIVRACGRCCCSARCPKRTRP